MYKCNPFTIYYIFIHFPCSDLWYVVRGTISGKLNKVKVKNGSEIKESFNIIDAIAKNGNR